MSQLPPSYPPSGGRSPVPPGPPAGGPPGPPPGYPPFGGPPPGGPPIWGEGGPGGPGRRSSRVPLVLVIVVLVVAGVGVGALVLAQDGDGGSSANRAAYVDAVTVVQQADGGPTGSQSRCLAEATVDVLGVDAFRDAATPEELRADPERGLRSWGLAPDEAQAEAFYDRLEGCGDVRAMWLDSLSDLPPEAVECIDQAMDDDLLKRLFVANFVDGDDYMEVNPDIRAELATVTTSCDSLVE
jgi:hypothetical protein